MRKIVGILRSAVFSPNSDDYTIMKKVKAALEKQENEVVLFPEDNIRQLGSGVADVLFSMARSKAALHYLEAEERRGRLVINSPGGVRRCERSLLTRLMMELEIPCADSEVMDLRLRDVKTAWKEFPAWLKRGDTCAQQREDVCFVTDRASLFSAIEAFRQRNITSAVISGHLTGDIVKFYGVEGTSFFKWLYPTLEHRYSKFGFEEINGPARRFPFNVAALKQISDRIAHHISVPVYGGDAVVDEKGRFRIIDFNDWPSFSSCTDHAARAISDYIVNRIAENG